MREDCAEANAGIEPVTTKFVAKRNLPASLGLGLVRIVRVDIESPQQYVASEFVEAVHDQRPEIDVAHDFYIPAATFENIRRSDKRRALTDHHPFRLAENDAA